MNDAGGMWTERNAAIPMTLGGRPASETAEALVARVLNEVVRPCWGRQERASSAVKAAIVIGAFLSDLLRAHSLGRWGKHGMRPADFPARDRGFGRSLLLPSKQAMEDRGFLLYHPGRPHTVASLGQPGQFVSTGGPLSIFKLTSAFMLWADGAAIEPWTDHWVTGKAKAPPSAPRLSLHQSPTAKGQQGVPMAIDPDDAVGAAILREVEKTNSFLDAHQFGGLAFVGLRRIFNGGENEATRWRQGGRYYSLKGGDRYEAWSGSERRERIIINGEPVVDIDVSATNLTLLYGLRGQAFDATAADPYHIPGIDREAVKAWINTAIGKGRADGDRWSPSAGIEYRKAYPDRKLSEDYRAADVRRAALEAHPILKGLADYGIKAIDFQYNESEVLRLAMEILRGNGVPSLPVHDSLLVPMSAERLGVEAWGSAFSLHFKGRGVIPRVKVRYPLSPPSGT